LFCFKPPVMASPSAVARGNPSLSAEKLKRLQVVEFEGVFLFEIHLLFIFL